MEQKRKDLTCGLGSVWSLSSAWSLDSTWSLNSVWSLGSVPVGFNCRLMCEGGSVRGSGLICGSGLVIRVNSSPVHFILLLHFFKIDTPHLTQEICPHLTNTNEENQRVNRDFGEAPLEPTSLFEREPRQITSDGYLHDGGNRYPVSMELPSRRSGSNLFLDALPS